MSALDDVMRIVQMSTGYAAAAARVRAAIAAYGAAERERCAAICEERGRALMTLSETETNREKAKRHYGEAVGATECAMIIRAIGRDNG